MIKTVIKRDGREESFDMLKLSHWAEWASEKLKVDWGSIVNTALLKCENKCTTVDLQHAMIEACVVDNASTQHQLMGGRLLIGDYYHKLYGGVDSIPSVRQQHTRLVNDGVVENLTCYSNDDWEFFNTIINHSKDLTLKHTQVEQLVGKYSLRDKDGAKETPQFLFMRQALWYASKLDGDKREHVKNIYELLSNEVVCAPTPDHLYVGTTKGCSPSCVVVRGEDNLPSLGAMMQAVWSASANGSGIGGSLETRANGDPVRNGAFKHNGKLEYYRSLMDMARANQQSGRAGAITMHYTCLDPEVETIARMKNPTTVQEKRLGLMDYSFGANTVFADAVKNNKEWMLVSTLYAPELYELLYQPDKELFKKEYEKVRNDTSIPKTITTARKVLFSVLRESVETRQYEHFTDEMNRNTPFKDKIYSSNLCVSGDTLILTDKGNVVISEVVDQKVNVWNGEEWSETVVRKTGENQKLLRVTTSSGNELKCTPYHKFYVMDGYSKVIKKEAKDLVAGDKLIKSEFPVIEGDTELEFAYENGFFTAEGTTLPSGKSRVYFYNTKMHLLKERFSEKLQLNVKGNQATKRLQTETSLLRDKFFVPSSYHTLGSRLDWLAGLFDGDGYITNNKGARSLQLTSVNKEFLQQVKLLLQTIGVNSKVVKGSDEGLNLLPANDGSGGKKSYLCKASYRILVANTGLNKLLTLGLKFSRLSNEVSSPNRESEHFSKVVSVSPIDGLHDTYCFNEPKRHMGVFNGILTGQCQEIALPTKSFNKGVEDLFNPESEGEIATCNLMGINVATINLDDTLYEKACYYSLLMIMLKIKHGSYPFPSMKNTSINRMNAGVSIISLAHLMAKQGLKYSSLFGKKLIHRVAETHSYFLHKSALRIGKEYGNARWIDRTRYPDGWFPVDSRNRNVESISYQPLKRDWESLRKEIIDNKGIAFSVLETSVPSESSSMAQDATNSLYPIRGGVITKKDASRTVQWIAPEWGTLGDNYELAWDIDSKHITDMYAIVQGFTGQGISADYWMTHSTKDGRVSVSGKKLISEWLYRQSVGMKSRYYINHKTGGVYTENNEQENGCSSGGCTL